MDQPKTTDKPVNKVLNFVFFVCFVGLLTYAFWLNKDIYESMRDATSQMLDSSREQSALTQTYSQRYQEANAQLLTVTDELKIVKQKYSENQNLLSSLSTDLQQTKAALAQASVIIDEATNGKVQLPENLAALAKSDNKVTTQLEGSVAVLQEKNQELIKEMNDLQAQLRQLSGDVNSINEGRTVLNSLYKRIKLVKSKISDYRHQSENIRVAALKERDKVRMILGNKGYFVREGQLVKVDNEMYAAASLDRVKDLSEASAQNKKMQIGVTFFK